MTYRLLLWFDMLEEDGRSTTIRGLFTNRMPPLSRDLSNGNKRRTNTNGSGFGNGFGSGFGSYGGYGDSYEYGDGSGFGWPKILMVKI